MVTFDDGTTSIGQARSTAAGAGDLLDQRADGRGSPHTISAVYGGDSNFSGSTSNSLTQTVTKNTTSTSLTASTATSAFNTQRHLHGHGDQHRHAWPPAW